LTRFARFRLSPISEEELEKRKMPENKKISADINETSEQPRAVLVRLAPEIATRVETDAREREVSPTEIVRSIVCEHYSAANEQAEFIRGIRDLIEDRFRHTVYEISRTRSSLYNMVEQSETFGLDRPRLKEIQQLSRKDATDYLASTQKLIGGRARRKPTAKGGASSRLCGRADDRPQAGRLTLPARG
jgi:tRNA A37 N6-isopentenylltransferase MiaA